MKTETYNHHGKDVVVISEVKGKHRQHCLCMTCHHFTPEDRDNNCVASNALYELCREFDTVTPVYECPKYQVKGVVVIDLNGRFDAHMGSYVKRQVTQALSLPHNSPSIHINMEGVEFINSLGLGALVSCMKAVRLACGTLTISNMASYVNEIFEITQLSHVFNIFDTLEEALEYHKKEKK